MRELADDPKHFGSRVDTGELAGHQRRAPTIIGFVEHGPNGFAQRLWRWLVAGKIDPDAGPCNTRVDVGLVFSQPRGDKRNSKAQRLVDTAITAVGDEHVDRWQYPFERQISGKARVAWNWARYGVDGASARGGDDQQIWLVRERRQRRADQQAEIMIGQRSLRNQNHLARAVEIVGPGRQRSLIGNDGGRANEMYRGRDVARKLKTWN